MKGRFPQECGEKRRKMVGTVRFELTTSSTPRKRATKLRYVPTTKPADTFAPTSPTIIPVGPPGFNVKF